MYFEQLNNISIINDEIPCVMASLYILLVSGIYIIIAGLYTWLIYMNRSDELHSPEFLSMQSKIEKQYNTNIAYHNKVDSIQTSKNYRIDSNIK